MDQDVLLTFAEVGVAIAGFSGIVVALGKRALGQWTQRDRYRLRDLLFASLGTGIFGFLPIVLTGANMSPAVALQYASAVFFFYILVGLTSFLRGSAGKLGPVSWVFAIPTLLILSMQALVAFNVIYRVAEFAYYLALFWLILLSMANFAQLLLETYRDQDQPSDD